MVEIENSSDLTLGRRPMYKFGEFSISTILVIEIWTVKFEDFSLKCYTLWEHDHVYEHVQRMPPCLDICLYVRASDASSRPFMVSADCILLGTHTHTWKSATPVAGLARHVSYVWILLEPCSDVLSCNSSLIMCWVAIRHLLCAELQFATYYVLSKFVHLKCAEYNLVRLICAEMF